jgi:CRISPR-associated protein Csm3
MAEQSSLKGKIKITAIIKLETGLHIGAASDFAPIGAVDSPFIRDSLTKQPIIPGSSLKGKLRTLLAKVYAKGHMLNKIEDDTDEIKRLFGLGAGKNSESRSSRLQFFDLKMTADSVKKFGAMDLDTYIGEVKFENTINRITAVANPRQIERVPAGVEFDFQLVYNIEKIEEFDEDMKVLNDGFKLLQMDYLGGSGSRGYGRISFRNFGVEVFALNKEEKSVIDEKTLKLKELFEGVRVPQ